VVYLAQLTFGFSGLLEYAICIFDFCCDLDLDLVESCQFFHLAFLAVPVHINCIDALSQKCRPQKIGKLAT